MERLPVRAGGPEPRPELVALKDVDGNADAFAQTAKAIAETSEFNLVLMSEKSGHEGRDRGCGFKRPLLYAATEANLDAFGRSRKEQRAAAGR
jgi:acetyl-CoA decarbonylase/synthase, CODH/ACS complex subunit gamma